ncbi:nuclear transport factor 2 family protein [Speluncibacter jeojiensis]|uniref:Nuclear transport factor 2 family protein n=1 Tax=Speluncibacter jeojiensis TaxID=2710754 RepID=A0A9X4LXR0_9ACTN|nr:nuclear transport factor 2 family protein [Corynebacteriales bacterium D3-21]
MTTETVPELTMSPAEQFLAIEEIKRTFARRLRCMDEKRWEIYPTLHTDDVISETWGGLPEDKQPRTTDTSNRVVGAEKLTRAISRMLDGRTKVTSVHHGHAPEIELTSDTTARGVWAMEDKLWWTNGDHEEHLHGYGHYHEEYRKVNGRWLISYRKLTRLREDTTPGFFDFLQPL